MKYASVMQLYSGYEAEYKRRHDELWPELAEHLIECGIFNYRIYLLEETGQLFASFEAESLDTKKLSEHPVMQRWWEYMADIMETKDASFEPVSIPLTNVFTFNERAPKTDSILVLDIGKTNVKLCLIDPVTGQCQGIQKTQNQPNIEGNYPHADTGAIWAWMKKTIAQMTTDHYIQHICITTHGATIACLSGDELALPILDYEYEAIEEFRGEYSALRPEFKETFSPELPAGLNLGAQLYWLNKRFPQTFANVDCLLTYPQYWAHKLTGKAVSEVTSLGCHTDLWNPTERDFSCLAKSMGWDVLFPTLTTSGNVVGKIKKSLVEELGLPKSCLVYNGIHDSNASLVPYIDQLKKPTTVISSGTWTIIATINGQLSGMDENKDMLANVDVNNHATPTIRFMGGREWEQLRGETPATLDDIIHVLTSDIFALPCFAHQGGPFKNQEGKIFGKDKLVSEGQESALADIYVALMSDYCLDLTHAAREIFVEGAFSDNTFYLECMAALRPHSYIYPSSDATGTSFGAAMLSVKSLTAERPNQAIKANSDIVFLLSRYKTKWRDLLQAHRETVSSR